MIRTSLTLVVGMLAAGALAGCSPSTSVSAGGQQDDVLASPSTQASPLTQASPASSSPPASVSALPSPSASGQLGAPGPVVKPTFAPGNGVCDEGLAYACGDTGPGGGVVFYASSAGFTCGTGLTSSCNFLEVAPNGWNGTLVDCPGGCGGSPAKTSDYGSDGIGTGRGFHYCSGMGEKNSIPDASGTAIGQGYANTTAMVQNCTAGDAGALARNYSGGGLNDWSVPSLDELNALYVYPNRNAIGGFAAGEYWSSSQAAARTAYRVSFSNGAQQSTLSKSETYGVRPVRAF